MRDATHPRATSATTASSSPACCMTETQGLDGGGSAGAGKAARAAGDPGGLVLLLGSQEGGAVLEEGVTMRCSPGGQTRPALRPLTLPSSRISLITCWLAGASARS